MLLLYQRLQMKQQRKWKQRKQSSNRVSLNHTNCHVVTQVSTAVPILMQQKSHSDVIFCGILLTE